MFECSRGEQICGVEGNAFQSSLVQDFQECLLRSCHDAPQFANKHEGAGVS